MSYQQPAQNNRGGPPTDQILRKVLALVTGPNWWVPALGLVAVIVLAVIVGWWFLPVGLLILLAALYMWVANGSGISMTLTGPARPGIPPSAASGIDLSALTGNYLGYGQRAAGVSQEIERAIAGTPEPGLRGALLDATRDLPELVQTIYSLALKAQSVDTGLLGAGNMESLSADVMRLDAAMKGTNDQFQKDQYAAALDGKLQQMQNFTDTRVAVERWNSQIDNALSALDTLYSQVLRIKSSEVLSYSTATDELSHMLRREVEVLKATSDAFDSVYRT